MIIDLSNYDSYKSIGKDLLQNYFAKCNYDFEIDYTEKGELIIENYAYKCGIDYDCDLVKSVVAELYQYSIKLFHITKVNNSESIVANGIEADFDKYIKRIKNVLNSNEIESTEIERFIVALSDRFYQKYDNREYQVCFYSRADIKHNSEENFSSYIGGELAQQVCNHESFEDIEDVLQHNGKSVVVICNVPISFLMEYMIEGLAIKIIRDYIARNILHVDYSKYMDVDLSTAKTITSDLIEKIILYSDFVKEQNNK